MAEGNAGQRLDLDIRHAVALRLGEAAHLCLGEFDVLDHLGWQAVDQRLNFRARKAERFRRPFVEFLRDFPHRLIPTRNDVGQDALNGLAHRAIRLGGLFDAAPGL